MFNAICGLGGWDWDWMVIKSHKPSKNTFRANTIHGNTRSKISTLLSDLNLPATQLVFQYSNRTCPVTKYPTHWALVEYARVIITQLLSSPRAIFCSKTTKFSPKLAFLTIAGPFGALLMGWLVVVARGLYLARHLFTLS